MNEPPLKDETIITVAKYICISAVAIVVILSFCITIYNISELVVKP